MMGFQDRSQVELRHRCFTDARSLLKSLLNTSLFARLGRGPMVATAAGRNIIVSRLLWVPLEDVRVIESSCLPLHSVVNVAHDRDKDSCRTQLCLWTSAHCTDISKTTQTSYGL